MKMKQYYFLFIALLVGAGLSAQCTDIFISEYVEGSNNSKGIEIYNPTNAPIDLSGYQYKRYSNGSTSNPNILQLTGTIQPYDVIVVVNGQTDSVDLGGGAWSTPCDPALQALADILDNDYPAPSYFNGDDALTLETNAGAIVDIFGKVGEDPGQGWTDDPTANYTDANGGTWITKDRTLQRHADVEEGVKTNPALFIALNEYDTLPKNYWGGLGSHDCNCDPAFSIGEDDELKLSVYPNPTSGGKITIATGDEIVAIRMYDVLGKAVIVESIYDGQIAFIPNLSVPAGMYIVEAITRSGDRLNKRLVVR
jgi:hypothetical protein